MVKSVTAMLHAGPEKVHVRYERGDKRGQRNQVGLGEREREGGGGGTDRYRERGRERQTDRDRDRDKETERDRDRQRKRERETAAAAAAAAPTSLGAMAARVARWEEPSIDAAPMPKNSSPAASRVTALLLLKILTKTPPRPPNTLCHLAFRRDRNLMMGFALLLGPSSGGRMSDAFVSSSVSSAGDSDSFRLF